MALIDELEKEIQRLKNFNQDLRDQLSEGRHYLMSVEPKNLTVEDALEAFGFGRNGVS